MKVCIIGGVAAGASAATRLRRLDEKAEIVMFERGPYVSYANCGLPYHISGAIAERDDLVLFEPDDFRSRFKIDVRTNSEVIAIDRAAKNVRVRPLNGSAALAEYSESYDKLVLAPGAAPFVPKIEGLDETDYYTLRTIPDMDRILERIQQLRESGPLSSRTAVILGGGFIGIELAENLRELGLGVHIVELAPQVMTPVDPELASLIHAKLMQKGLVLHLGTSISRVEAGAVTKLKLSDGTELQSDLFVSAVGVRPENALAKAAGLAIGSTGGISVNGAMQTSDPDIFAAGDAIEIDNFVTGSPGLVPLAGPANRQGRIIADVIAGKQSAYRNTLGTGIVKVFDLQVATTGINEKVARKIGIKYQAIHLHPANHAGYYPGSLQMALKVLFNPETGALLGAQGIGTDGVDKRIDVFATAIRAGMSVRDLEHLELCYAPPFGSAKDPVNMAGFVASNIMDGLIKVITPDEARKMSSPLFIDVRTVKENSSGCILGSKNIPLDDLRARLDEVPRDRDLVLYCQVGIRSYNAFRILAQHGFTRLNALSGGYKTWRSYG